MFEFPLGSRILIVNGSNFPSKACYAFCKIYKVFDYSDLLSPFYIFYFNSRTNLSINPRTVIIWGLLVEHTEISNYSILMLAFSE
jgi:hypothetical protein